MKLQQARKDYYRRLARDAGFKSRAAYKLLQMNEKYQLLKPGLTVIDVGSAPGGWLQVASQEVGPTGLVVGVDQRPMDLRGKNIRTIQADVGDTMFPETVLAKARGKAHVVLSDLSPNITGIWDLDHIRQIELTERVLQLLPRLLKPGGDAVLKAFEGERLKELTRETRTLFREVTISKPPASRGESSEVYLVCRRYAGGTLPPTA